MAIDVGNTVTWNNPSFHTVTHIALLTTGKPLFHKMLGPGDSLTHTFSHKGQAVADIQSEVQPAEVSGK